MKLLKQQRAPIAATAIPAGHGQQGRNSVGFPQKPFKRSVVALLIGTAGGATAVQLQEELITPHRPGLIVLLQVCQELPHRAGTGGQGGYLPLPEIDLLQQLLGGTTTVITNTRNPERRLQPRGLMPCPLLSQHLHRIGSTPDRRQHQAAQFRPSPSAPAEQTMGERVLSIPGQLVGAEPAHTSGCRHRRQASSEAKAVRQPGQLMGPFREAAPAVVLTEIKLIPQRRRADQHTVGLHPGAIDRFPAAGAAGLLDLRKQSRAMLLHPGVESRRGMGKAQLGPATHQSQR